MNTPRRPVLAAGQAMMAQRRLPLHSSGVRINFLEGGMVVQFQEVEKRKMKSMEYGPIDLSYTAQIALVQELLHGDDESWKDEDDSKLDRLLERIQKIEEKIRGKQPEMDHYVLLTRSVLCKTMDDLEKVLAKAEEAQKKINALQESGEHLAPDLGALDLAR